MRFSFIIPAYNVEEYIAECFDSILKQKCSDYEIVVVYDQSKDNTLQKINTYVEKADCIKVIDNKEKKGLSHARNVGVSHANGDYLIFVDSDDYIDSHTLEYMNAAIEEYNWPDWIYGNGNYEFKDDNKTPIAKNNVPTLERFSGKTGIEMLSEFVLHREALWSVWGKAYKKSFWESLDCISEKPCREDVDMGYKIIENATSVATIPAFYYYRRGRKESLLNTFSFEQEVVFSDVMSEWLSYIRTDERLNEELGECILRRLNEEMCCALLPKIWCAEGEERDALLLKADRLKEYFDHPFNSRNRMISIAVKMIGLSRTCFILSKLKRIKHHEK